jgi:tetratricopeptide (TPR) repeat protein
MFEHRAYLPNIFLSIIAALLVCRLTFFKFWLPTFTMGVVVGVFAFLIIERINLWKEPMSFYRHELVHTADNARAYGALGTLFAQRGEFIEAEKWYKIALQVGVETKHLQAVTVINYLRVLIQNNQIPQASRAGVQSLAMLTKAQDKADVLILLSKLKAEQGLCQFSDGLRARAVKLYPPAANYPLVKCTS